MFINISTHMTILVGLTQTIFFITITLQAIEGTETLLWLSFTQSYNERILSQNDTFQSLTGLLTPEALILSGRIHFQRMAY
jgi:hypothetical protein